MSNWSVFFKKLYFDIFLLYHLLKRRIWQKGTFFSNMTKNVEQKKIARWGGDPNPYIRARVLTKMDLKDVQSRDESKMLERRLMFQVLSEGLIKSFICREGKVRVRDWFEGRECWNPTH